MVAFLRVFSRLGPLNARLQEFLSGYLDWKKAREEGAAKPVFFDLLTSGALSSAERTFYRVGVSPEEAKTVLREQLANLEELARFTSAWVASRVLGESAALTDRSFVEALDPLELRFDPAWLRRLFDSRSGKAGVHRWSFDPGYLERLVEAETETVGAAEPGSGGPR